MSPRHFKALVLTAVLCVIGTACSGVSAGGAGQSAADTSSASATLGAQAPTPQATTPDELQGSWAATLSTGEKVTLDLSPYGYVVHRTETVVGDVDFEGDRVVFTSPHCELGPGPYRWSIDSGELTFEPLEPRDPCPGRLIFLDGAVYTKEH